MGDVGSLALGGLLAEFQLFSHLKTWTLLLIGLVYVCETASVILQVASFKLFGRRIFKMSPIHHHFEMCGWSECKIDFVFWSCRFNLFRIHIMDSFSNLSKGKLTMKKITTYQNKKVLVLGLAKSGVSAAKLLHELGVLVTVNDAKQFDQNPDAQDLLTLGIRVVTGGIQLNCWMKNLN